MADLPFMPIATDALLADAGDLPNELFGAYCRLLFKWWREGAEPEKDERRLARWAGLKSTEFDDLKEFLTPTDDGWIQKRLVETFAKVKEKSQKAKDAAARRWDSEGNADASENQCERNANQNHNHSSNLKITEGARGARNFSGKKKAEKVSREKKITPIPPADPKSRQVFDFVLGRWGPEIVASWFCSADGRSLIRMNCTAVVIEPHGKVAHERIRNQYWPAIAQEFGENVRLEKFTANAVREGK